jgi:TusA-related sulfurtransferase
MLPWVESQHPSPSLKPDWTIDTSGKCCPLPILEIAKAIRRVDVGGVVLLVATDPAVEEDLRHWCSSSGNELLALRREGGQYWGYVRRLHRPPIG